MEFILSPIKDTDKLILKSLLMALEIHRYENGGMSFWIHGEGSGTTFLMQKEDKNRLIEFLLAQPEEINC